jgi:hypothetical protein
MGEDGHLELPVEHNINKRISMEAAVRSWGENMVATLLMSDSDEKWRRLRFYRRQGNQIQLIVMGLRPGMMKLAHPTDAEKLVPAIDCIMEYAPTLKVHAPAAVQGLGVDEMPRDVSSVQFYREIRHDEDVFVHGAEVLITNAEQSLDARARTCYRRLSSLMQENFDFGHDLKRLRDLVKGSAEEGQDTKKRLAKARAAAKDAKDPNDPTPAAGTGNNAPVPPVPSPAEGGVNPAGIGKPRF